MLTKETFLQKIYKKPGIKVQKSLREAWDYEKYIVLWRF